MNEPVFIDDVERPPGPSGADVIIAVLIFSLAIGLIIGIILLADPPGRSTFDPPGAKLGLTAGILLAQNLAMLAAVWLPIRRRGRRFATVIDLNPLPWRGVLIALIAGVLIGVGLDLALGQLQHVLGLPERTPGAELLAPAGFSWLAFAVMMLLGAVVAPICEEVLFRGLLFGWLRRRMHWSLAAALAAVPFGLLHVEPLHVLYAIVAGFLLATLYQKAGSLWSSVLAHIAINSIAIASVYWALASGVPLDQI